LTNKGLYIFEAINGYMTHRAVMYFIYTVLLTAQEATYHD